MMSTFLSLLALAVLATLVASGDWRDLLHPLVGARTELLAAAVAFALSVELAKTVRWQLLLGLGSAPRPALLALILSARLLNAVAPLRAGDVWRVASVVRAERRSLFVAGGSVLAEKALDATALAAISFGALLLGGVGALSHLAPSQDALAAVGTALLAVLALALALGILARSRARGIRRWLTARMADAQHLRQPPVLLAVASLTLAGMALGLLANLMVLRALGLSDSALLGAAMLAGGYAAGLVPAGPGQLGVFELAVAAPLIALGIPVASAVAAALALHLVLLANVALGGATGALLGLLTRHTATEALDR